MFLLCDSNFTAFHDLQAIVEPLKNRKDGLKGVLVDTYVAGEMSDFSSEELRVNKIIDHNSYYGIVFGGGKLEGREFQTCFEDYVLSNQADIFETVKQNTQPMSVSFLYTLLIAFRVMIAWNDDGPKCRSTPFFYDRMYSKPSILSLRKAKVI